MLRQARKSASIVSTKMDSCAPIAEEALLVKAAACFPVAWAPLNPAILDLNVIFPNRYRLIYFMEVQ
jgi:hypothetical protein